MYDAIDQSYPKILFFSSTHCAPCLPVEIQLKRINISMFGKKLRIEKISIDLEENRHLTQEYRITSVPTLIIADKRLSVNIAEEDIIDAILYAFISSVKLWKIQFINIKFKIKKHNNKKWKNNKQEGMW